MSGREKIDRIYQSARRIPIDDFSKIVIMSDCHRGNGSHADNFSKNQMVYFHALAQYYGDGFTYIELGDGDELWEIKSMDDIKRAHTDVFWLLSKFYAEGRFHMLFGNHDMVKKSRRFAEKNLADYYDEHEKKRLPLFDKEAAAEGLVLDFTEAGGEILLLHGHQGTFINDRGWRLGRFLVRYLWKPLETIGVNDPTDPAKNMVESEHVSRMLADWTRCEKKLLVAGHTHKPVFPDAGQGRYFNDGSCVHPRCVTAIEITNGHIALVKWHVRAAFDSSLYIAKEVLAGPQGLRDYFRALKD